MRFLLLACCLILFQLSCSAFYVKRENLVCTEREKCGEASVDESELKIYCDCENGLKCNRPDDHMLDFFCVKATNNLHKVVFSRFGRR
uniref:Uncharacterized protein n=1 Tax=Plectus sambesii TaxID=2011161 RepID=A0A914WJ97_9BILA